MGNNNDFNEEIDFKNLFSIFLRFKKIISASSIFGIMIGGLIGVNTKKIWQGEFQIVVETSEAKDSLSSLTNSLPLNMVNKKDELKTQIEILKSPSVIMNIFEFVKSNKILMKEPGAKNLRFNNWRNNNFSIFETQKTSVLNIRYLDNNKEIILPVLDRISLTYQKYSTQKRSENLDKSEKYLNKQLEIYKEKSMKSQIDAQQFAIDNQLTFLKFADIDKEIENVININQIRIDTSIKIRDIEFQIAQLEKIGNDPTKLLYFGTSIKGLSDTGLPSQLKSIEDKLEFKRLIFTEEDDSIKELIQRRDTIIPIFKQRALSILNADKIIAEAQLKLYERPSGTLIKYEQLNTDAGKDKLTLRNIQNQYGQILLEKARNRDPWKLITKPTIYPFPVAPNIKVYLILGLLVGFLLGNLISIYLQKSKDIILTDNEFVRLSNSIILHNLSVKEIDSWDKNLEFFSKTLIKKNTDKTLIFFNKTIDNLYIDAIKEKTKKILDVNKFQFSSNLSEISNCSSIILIVALGQTKREEFKRLIKNISILDIPILGIVLLDNIEYKYYL